MRWIFLETPSKCMKMQFLNCYMLQGILSCDSSPFHHDKKRIHFYIYKGQNHLKVIFGSRRYPALGERLASGSRSGGFASWLNSINSAAGGKTGKPVENMERNVYMFILTRAFYVLSFPSQRSHKRLWGGTLWGLFGRRFLASSQNS